MHRSRRLTGLVALFAAFVLVAADVEARVGRGGGSGSRGMRTWQAPPPTNTAPKQTAPIERSIQQPGLPSAAQRLQAPTAQRPGFFNRQGFLPGLMTGLLGAGLIGLLLGSGFFSGLGSLAGMLGFLLQGLLIGGLIWLALNFFRRRSQSPEPAYAGAGSPLHRDVTPSRYDLGRSAAPSSSVTGAGADEIGVGQQDLDVFERLLGEIQAAYSREDLSALRERVTPELLSYLAEELAENASRGVVNRVSEVKLLQGDVAESWREGEVDYATVAMRFALIDVTEERETGRIVEGSTELTEATEVWTFMRARGGRWLLSAIQQI